MPANANSGEFVKVDYATNEYTFQQLDKLCVMRTLLSPEAERSWQAVVGAALSHCMWCYIKGPLGINFLHKQRRFRLGLKNRVRSLERTLYRDTESSFQWTRGGITWRRIRN
jgi:hypothetical protein